MFSKKIPIIYLSKDKLKVVLVKLGKEPQIIKSDETTWNKDSLTESFNQAKKQLKAKSVRILLSDDLSYVLNINIPFNTKEDKERSLIKEKIKSEVPEILENEDWDFKETGRRTQSDKQIIVFAPVKSVFTLISQALEDTKLTLQAIEPEIVATVRNSNPLIGLALKKDLKGKDKKVLNLLPKKTGIIKEIKLLPKKKDSSISKDQSEPKDKPLITKNTFIIFTVTFILSALIAGGILVQNNALENNLKPSPTPLIVATPTPTPSPSPSPSPSPEPEIVLSDYKTLVLNGTGGKGIAAAVKDLLEAENFEDIEADNANNFDHLKTTIQFKKDTPEQLWKIIETVLSESYDTTRSAELLTDSSEYDVIITVGKLLER